MTDSAMAYMEQRIAALEAENIRLREKLGPLAEDRICLNCGASEPCHLNTAETSGDPEYWPGSPCTFDPTPQQLWDDNKRLRTELANEKAGRQHSCHANCDRSGCVNRRLREELSDAQEKVAELERKSLMDDAILAGDATLITGLKAELDAAQATIAKMRDGLTAVSLLIANSYGVAGLHLNGDAAPWGDLQTGGKYEDWLADFDEALALLADRSRSEK